MIYKNKLKKIIVIYIIIISFSINSFGRYYQRLDKSPKKATIAEPIFITQKLNEEIKLDVNKETTNKEYNFLVKNYKKENKTNRISEVSLDFQIEILRSNYSFPVECRLYDCSNGEELLKGRYKTDDIVIQKNILFEKQYKLVISWKENEEMACTDDIDIIINANQIL